MEKQTVNLRNVIDEYIGNGGLSRENAKIGWSPTGLLFTVASEIMENDYLQRLGEAGFEKLVDLHNNGGVHIHDLQFGWESPYCAGYSLFNLLNKGVRTESTFSKPPKHFRSVISQMINFIGASTNEFAGAQAFSDIDLYLAPYAYKSFLDYLIVVGDIEKARKLVEREIRQTIQEFIFSVNFSTRYGSQPPFSNISLAIDVPGDMKDRYSMVGGKLLNYWYGNDMLNGNPLFNYDEENHILIFEVGLEIHKFKTMIKYDELNEWQDLICDAILSSFIEGDATGKGFTFPILTINVTPEFFQNPVRHKIYELSAKFGTPYFQNFINGISAGEKIRPDEVRSMCCRLSINKKKINKHLGGIFGNAEQTGSIQVVTISLPYLAMQSLDDMDGEPPIDVFFNILEDYMDLIRDEQLWKREIVEDFFERGFFLTAKDNLDHGFKSFFTTIGFIGLWETIQVLDSNDSFLTDKGMELAKNILTFMEKKVEEYNEITGKLFNLEATPAEGAAFKLAKKALKAYPDIPHGGTKESPYLNNSCHLPPELGNQLDLIFRTQTQLQVIPSGGTVVHFYTGEDMSVEEIEGVVKTVCNTSIPFFSITTVYSMCPICGYVVGKHETCPNQHTEEQLKNVDSKYLVWDEEDE